MLQGTTVDLDSALAPSAAKLSLELRLPLADSCILATARRLEAVLWTQDEDFEGIESVNDRARPWR